MTELGRVRAAFIGVGIVSLVILTLINYGVYLIGGTGWMMVSLGITGFYAFMFFLWGVYAWFVAKDVFND
jgi:hypothetical protein